MTEKKDRCSHFANYPGPNFVCGVCHWITPDGPRRGPDNGWFPTIEAADLFDQTLCDGNEECTQGPERPTDQYPGAGKLIRPEEQFLIETCEARMKELSTAINQYVQSGLWRKNGEDVLEWLDELFRWVSDTADID